MNPDINWNSTTIITLLISLILVLAIIYTSVPGIVSLLQERRLKKAIRKLGKSAFRNVVLPDGMGGNIFIDYLVLGEDSIIAVMLKRYRGTIFCAENIDQWTQLLGKRSFKFSNPLRQNEMDLQILKGMLPDISVNGLVLFHGDCDFPKGKPDNVKTVNALLLEPEPQRLVPPVLLQDAWQQLADTIKAHHGDTDLARSYFERKRDHQKWVLPTILVLLLMGWLYLRLVLLG